MLRCSIRVVPTTCGAANEIRRQIGQLDLPTPIGFREAAADRRGLQARIRHNRRRCGHSPAEPAASHAGDAGEVLGRWTGVLRP